jgi:hypothetical protein
MPNGFDPAPMIRKILDRVNNREGVSRFEFENSDEFGLPTDQEMLEAFVFSNAGFVYHDLFVNVYAEMEFGNPRIKGNFRIGNRGIFPLTQVNVNVICPPEIVGQFEPMLGEIQPGMDAT